MEKVLFFDVHAFEKAGLVECAATRGVEAHFLDSRLGELTVGLAKGFSAVSCFVNDALTAPVLAQLAEDGTKLVALRCAGFNNVDLPAAAAAGITIVRVPEYSPHAVAEHATALLLTLNRKTHKAWNRTREMNFSLDGLVGFDLYGKTVGVVGAGRIGQCFINIMLGFGCKILYHDPDVTLSIPGVQASSLEDLFSHSDVVSLHVPLNEQTRHLVSDQAFSLMKSHAIILNTGRGALIDTVALIRALKGGRIGGAGLDVYEEEEKVFFRDLSFSILDDDLLARLMTFPNVIITSHQGFLTHEALQAIANTTFDNIENFFEGKSDKNRVVHE